MQKNKHFASSSIGGLDRIFKFIPVTVNTYILITKCGRLKSPVGLSFGKLGGGGSADADGDVDICMAWKSIII
jgi:hypothetical protein